MGEKKSKFIAKRVSEKEDGMLGYVCQLSGRDKGEVLLRGVETLYALAKAISEVTQDAEEGRRLFEEILSARDDSGIVNLEAEAALHSVRYKMEQMRRFRSIGT